MNVFTVNWGADDMTGGPLDDVFASLRKSFPGLRIERLAVANPADDDNLWYLWPADGSTVQIDTNPNGELPFYLESDSTSADIKEVAAATELLTNWLRA